TGFSVEEVERDGRPEPYHTESLPAGTRVYIGDADVFLDPGEYTYTLRYITTRQLRFFDDYDELYWNVTGNFWTFPIRTASATVLLPEGARILQHAAYTGYRGSTASDARAIQEGPGRIAFETTRPLRAREGLTVAVAFPKGVVQQPSELATTLRRVLDNWGTLLLVIGVPGVILFYIWAWRRAGQDPPKGTIIPQFHPPDELTPAGTSFLFYRGFNKKRGVSKAFLAALVALAVGRHVSIRENDDEITLDRGPNEGRNINGPGEQRIYDLLLADSPSFSFTKAHGKTVAKALSRFSSAIEDAYGRGRYFTKNLGWFIPGVVLSIAALAAFLAGGGVYELAGGLLVPVTIFSVLGVYLLSAGLRRLRGSVPGGSYIVGGLALIAGVIVTLGVIAALFQLDGLTAIAPVAAFILAAVNVTFLRLLPAPTVAGRKLMDEVEGFRMYLETAEAERMNLVDAPEMSLELFERYLPHAVGLGVEEPWSQAYEAYVARTLPDRQGAYQPSWYPGPSWNSARIARSTSAVSSAIASGMALAVPSSSGSGSGGGGFSGGGGGGGGGGGW
ncbi:MAG TPA: DUF2207 domain-containing protein, partial [Hyphomicrobiales bacterium]|nr:DUF2207 domain-containing protein [Hyphomicrobiales bacterium]